MLDHTAVPRNTSRRFCVILTSDFSCSQVCLGQAHRTGCSSLRLGAGPARAQSSAHPPNVQVPLLRGQSSLSTLKDKKRPEVIFKRTLVSQVQQAESSSTRQHRCHGYKWQSLPSTCMECNLGRVQRASLKSHCHVMVPEPQQQPPCPCAHGLCSPGRGQLLSQLPS